MAQYITLPNGSLFEIRKGESRETALAKAIEQYPEAFGFGPQKAAEQPQSGFTPALKSGYSELKSGIAALAGRTGIMDEAAAEKYIKEQEAYQQRTFKPTATFGEAPVTKTLELLGGSLPYMAAPVVAGGAVALTPLTGTAATIAGLGAAGAASAGQFTGSNLRRQMEEGKALGETELAPAFAAALPQAALDMVSFRMIPGIRQLFTTAGKEIAPAAAKRIAEQGVKDIAKDYTLATGKAMTAEGLTEAGQQVLERMQAGLSLTDEKARSEYIDSLIGGAVLGGVLSPAGRYVERRGEAAKQEAERLQKAQEVRAQEEAVKEAARAQRATPEGQLAFAQDYEARLAEYNQLKALKKPGKDADPLTQVEFKETRKRMGELREGLTRDSVEYRKARETVRTLAEQQRLQGLSPEAFMLEQMGLETPAAAGAAPKTRTVINEFGQIVEEPIEAPKAEVEAPSAGEQYLNQQVDAARQMGIFAVKDDEGGVDVTDYVNFAMQDPALAAQAVKEGAGVQGLSPQENGALLGGIRLRLKALEKQAANQAKAEMAQRTEDLRAQKPGAEADAQQQAAAEMYEAQTTTLREGEPNFDYLDPIFEKALSGPEEVVKVDESVMPVRNAAALRARIDALEKEIADAREKEAAAKSTRNPSDVVAARQTIAKLNDQLGAMAGESGGYVTQLVEARRQQQEALTAINDAVDQLRSGQTLSGPNKVMASSTEQSLRNKAETARAQLVTAALQEAAIQRRAEGAPAMTRDEALKAAIKLSDTVNEMVERGATQAAPAEFEEVIVEPAQMRGDKIVRAARTERRMVKPAQQRISDAELKHFQERIKTVTRQLDKVEPKAEKADTGFLKQQFATTEAKKTAEARGETATTLAGELRRRTEFVRDKMARMKLTPKNVSKEWTSTRPGKDKEGRPIIVRQVVGSPYMAIRNSLNEAADALDSRNVSREFLDAVEPVVDAVLAGRELSPADLRAIDDALAAARPTAVEQKEAGQKALFPETEEDLGYIRATPANFAKSPRIKPVWEALANARVAAAKLAKSTAQRKAREKAAVETLERLKDEVEYLTGSAASKMFRFSAEQIAKAFVEFPKIGQTPEERALIGKYLGRSGLSPTDVARAEQLVRETQNKQPAKMRYDKLSQEDRILIDRYLGLTKLTDAEAVQVERIIREFREKHMAQYAQQIRQAQTLLAQGVRLDTLDNSLAEFMQSSNAAAKQEAKALAERIAPMRTAIAQIRSMMRKTPVLTESQKILARADEAVKKQRDDFQHAVEKALMKSKAELDSARAALLDPQLAQVQGSLDDAKKRLEKEQAELDRVQKRYNEILTQESGRDRTQLATYQLFRYEEKKAIIDDLKAQIAKQETALAKLVEDRFGELDGAAVTAQAMLDKNVRMERDYLEMLEAQLAGLRGENVLDKPNAYPFASRRAQLNVEAQKKLVQAAEKRADDFKKETAKAKEEVKQQWSGLRRVSGVVQSLDDIRAQERADKLREEAMSELRRADEKAQRDAEKQAVIDDIIEEQNKLALEIAKYPGPISRTGLVELMSSDKPTADEKALYTLKLDLVQRYGILDAQIDAIKEGKPRRASQPATAPSTALMSAQKPLRSGSDESLAESREANRLAQQIRGTKAAPEPKPSTRVQRKPLDENIGLFDEYEFSRGAATEGQTVAQLEKALDRAIGEKGLAARRIKLFSSVADFFASKEAYDYEGADIPSDAKAFVNPKNGDVFMFANNIAADESVGVLLHEVGVHIGFRKLFSAAKFNALVQSVKNWAAQKDGSLESKIAQRALARVKAAETSAEQFDEELLAYAVEEAVKAGVSPSALKNGSPIQNWLQLVLAALRNALTAFGINPNKLTSGDLVNMAYGAAQLEIRGTWHGSDAKFTAFDSKKAGAGEGAFDRRFDGTNNLGPGPYTTPQQEYAEYYQYAVPFGKAANATGYGDRSYQDYRALDERFMGANNAELTPDELQAKFESRLLNAYLRGVNAGESLNPTQNTSAQKLLEKLTASVRTPAEQAAVATLSLNNLRGLSERPPMGTLYRALDDMPRSQIYEVNAMHTVGDRPEIDALLKKYGNEYDVAQAKDEGRYAGNSLFFKMRRELGVDKTLQLLKKAGINAIEQNAERRYVERAYIGQAPEIIPLTETPVGLSKAEGRPGTGTLLFSKARYASPEMERLGEDTDKFVAKQRGTWEKVKANTTGLAFATQLVDRFAGFERLAKYMDSLKGSQMLYYLRMYDQRMNFVSQAVGNGAPQIVEKTRADGRKEYVIEAKDGANIKNVVQILSKAQPMVGNAEAVNRTFTMYLAALRAQRVGLAALNFGKDVTQDMLDNAINLVERTPGLKRVFDDARNEYNSYNRDLMKFLASTGAISEKLAERLSSTNDYIPFYREQDGNAMLIIGGENPIRIGNIAEQPYLQELVGGDTAILDFMTSSVQNTNMLMDMGLRNLSTKNAVFELINLNAAKIVKGRPAGTDVVKFKVDGEDRYAVLDTETVTIGGERFSTGVPAELLVKGMEGIPTQMPALMRLMAVPAQLLRKAVTLSPMYMAKQLFRDSLAAPIVSGANFTPVFGAIRQINGAAGKTLEERGITGGQYMSGTSEDITKILRDIATGKPGFMTAIGKLEALGMKADSLTRRAQYNSYIAQGMSEMEATLMALESMNFNKRGASPSVHMANALIPFFNAQIQGLNVLYKAFTGQMPFNDKLKVQQKLLMRGAMIAAVSLIYAAMMEDDEAYKNATPDQKYGNWFVRIPGFDEPVRLPVPFEIGYIFKGIPEALYNTMTTENGGEEAVKAFRQILLQTIPGGSSMPTIGGVPIPIPMPQALKPAIEAGLGKSFYTGRDILSAREKELLPEEQFRANTADVSKALGKNLGISPIIFESLVRGYTGTLGLAFLHTLSLGAPKSESPEAAVKRLSDYPLVGGAFQPNDAGGISNAVYERFNEDIKVRNSFKKMLTEGRTAEANELLQRRGNEIMEAEIGDVFKTNMTKLTQAERAIAASNLSPQEKRKQLDEVRRIKTGLAQTLREAADRTTPQ